MQDMKKWARPAAALLLPLFSTLAALPPAHAAVVGTAEVIAQERAALDRQGLLDLLERQDVRDRLVAAGVDPQQAAARVATLTEEEVRQLAGQFADLPAGGSDVVGALVLIFLVLLVTDLLGLTDVFPFVR